MIQARDERLDGVREALERKKHREELRAEREQTQRDMGLGYLVYAARRFARWSQRRLARAMDGSQSVISRWENRERTPSIDALFRVAFETQLELVIGLRDPRNGSFVVLGICQEEAPFIELELLEDRYQRDWLEPVPWRRAGLELPEREL